MQGIRSSPSVEQVGIQIIFRDASVVAVDKPTGLLTVPGRGADKQDCVYHCVVAQFPDARVVHRLDMDTSGLLLFARSVEVQRTLSTQFERREMAKQYVAIVEGVPGEPSGSVKYALRKDMEQRLPPKHLVDCVRGKSAMTDWRVVESFSDSARVELIPHTGRSHQLRVHMQSIGHPIVGDPIYGTRAERLMLHAERLTFTHPENGMPITLECPAPF